jgi:hypothetical protein
MSHHRLPLIAAGLLVAMLAVIGTAEAIIIYDFPIFGVVNGTQVARLNAALTPPPEGDLPCPGTLAFIDSQGKLVGDPDEFQLRGGAAAHKDFIGDPGLRIGDRLQIRAQVTYGDPNEFPGCAGAALTSVEVVDKLTRATHFIMTNPTRSEVPARQ